VIREVIQMIEKYIDNPSAQNEWKLASLGFLPLTPTIMSEFEQEIDNVYHVTDEEGLKTIKKIQGHKNQISTFSRGGEAISYGVRREAQFLVKLSGKTSFNADSDFNSQLSRNGHKWLDPARTEKGKVIFNKFSMIMNKLMIKKFKVKDRFEVRNVVEKLDVKGKKQFMKWYLDTAKKLINRKLLDDIRDSINNSKKTMSGWDNDEYFLSEIEELIDNLGFKMDGYIYSSEISKIGQE